jgi:AraC-like DNA-binding protein
MGLRTQLELFAAREFIGRDPTGERIRAALAPVLQTMREAIQRQDHTAFFEADRELHGTIIAQAEVPLLMEVWRQVWEALSQFHRSSLSEHWPDLRILLAEHEYLVSAVCSGDAGAAEDGIRHHLEAIWFRLAEQRGEILRETDPLQRAAAYLAFHYHRPIQLKEVAANVAFTSPGHLSKLFREHYGISFQTYLQRLRLEKAAELLRQTALPIARIARRVGYQDVSRFGQHFKRQYGDTCSQWRKKG